MSHHALMAIAEQLMRLTDVFVDDRRPIGTTGLPSNGTLVVCNDGSIWASFPNGEEQRVWVEGTPIPGMRRAIERAREAGV